MNYFYALEEYGHFDSAFNLAALKSFSESFLKPKIYIHVNVNGTQNITEYCTRNSIDNLVFTSSAAVYGNIESNKSILETDITKPLSPYSVTRLQGEKITEIFSIYKDLQAISLRVLT